MIDGPNALCWFAFVFAVLVIVLTIFRVRDIGRRGRADIQTHMRTINAINRAHGQAPTYPDIAE